MSTKIAAFDPKNLAQLREAITAALKPIAEQYGLKSIGIGNITWDATKFSTSITALTEVDVNNPAVLAKVKMHSAVIGFNMNIVDEVFVNGGRKFKVTSIDLKKPKFPIIAENLEDGKSYKFKPSLGMKFVNTEIVLNPVYPYAH